MEEVWAVLVAAGSGERLGAEQPKAFVPFGSGTLLSASLAVFEGHPLVTGVVCVVPEGWQEETMALARAVHARKGTRAVAGGASRAESVARGLAALPDGCDAVLVHDAARPLLRAALIDRVIDALEAGAEGVVPALPVTDTVKRVADGGAGALHVVETLHRPLLRAVQTPQGFPLARLRHAVAAAGDRLAEATDCASLVEADGGRVVCVDGDELNLKVTSRDDLERAQEIHRAAIRGGS